MDIEAKLSTINQKVVQIIENIGRFMDIDCQVDIQKQGENGNFLISVRTVDDARYLIGKEGKNLNALEHVIRVAIIKNSGSVERVVLDVNDYKKSRMAYITSLAREVVARVRSTQKAEMLAPMNPYERRTVHMELASYSDIVTESIGAEPQRRVLVKPS